LALLLIKKLGVRKNKTGNNRQSWAYFFCTFCKEYVEKPLCCLYRQDSCGCQGDKNKAKNHNSWNKGLTKETSIRVKENSENTSKGLKLYYSIEENRQKQAGKGKGKIISEETRQRMRNKALGRKQTEEAKQKIRNFLTGRKRPELLGELNSQWQNGKSFEIYPKEFKYKRNTILERDNYTCQSSNCKCLSKILDIHHIDYNKKNNNPDNLITLCRSCHAKTNGKNVRQYWTQFYTILINERMMQNAI